MFVLALREYCGISIIKSPRPKTYPDFGIHDPISGKSYTSLDSYRKDVAFYKEEPGIGILFYGGMHFDQSVIPAREYMRQLRERGCNIIPVFSTAPYNLKTIRTFFMRNDTSIIDALVYIQWFQLSTFGDSPLDVDTEWGASPGNVMTADGRLVIPALTFGNVLLGIHPARGYHSDPDKTTHDQTLPPHHQYVVFYRWPAQEWKADCIVHVGTRGTLESLKGKEIGMSAECFPENLIGDIPHLYYYHVVNTSEATIAKWRSLGTLVDYNSPSFTAGGLYDSWQTIDELIGEYYEARTLEPSRVLWLEKRILELAVENNIDATDIASIQEEIGMMKRSVIPKGLHFIGADIPPDDRMAFAVFYLRTDRATHPFTSPADRP